MPVDTITGADKPALSLLQIAARGVGLTLLGLLLPFGATLISTEMQWGPEDFVAAALLIFIACFGILLCRQYVSAAIPRLLTMALVLTLVLLTWLELAVGIF